MSLVPGANFGAYRIIEQAGRGGMATVYKAHQPALARFVAIKVLPSFFAEEPGFRERFQQEAMAVANLRHPNILSVFDYGEEEGVPYLVTEFVDGGTLAQQLGAPLPVDYVTRILGPIGSALDYAHARGVVHRDVKPSNILLARDGTPVLSDFGLAKMMGSLPRLTTTGTTVGTPEYMSPEQAEGATVGPSSDLYSLATVAYEMLTGQVPFSADTPLAVLLAHVHRPLPLPRDVNPALSPAVEEVLLKGLAKGPAARYATASELVAAMTEAGRGIPAPAGPPAPAAAPAQPTATAAAPSGATAPRPAGAPAMVAVPRRTALIAGSIALLVALLAGALALWQGGPLQQLIALNLIALDEPSSEPQIPSCPVRVAFGETIGCGISEAGEFDLYNFFGEAGDWVRVRLVETWGSWVPSSEVLQPDRSRVCGPSTSGDLDCLLTASGLHTILVSDATKTRAGGYNLYLQRLNGPVGCSPLSPGVPLPASIEVPGQMNCFTLEGASGDLVRIGVRPTSADLVPMIEVFRPGGNRPCDPTIAPEFDCRLDAEGRHALLIGDRPSASSRTGRYSVSVNKIG